MDDRRKGGKNKRAAEDDRSPAISRGTSADGVIVLGRSEVVGSSRDAASRLAPFRIDADHRRSAKLADIAS